MAPDGSIYPSAPDAETGALQLAHLAFEVLSSETVADRKAARLVERSVRRVFALAALRAHARRRRPPAATWPRA